LKTPKAGDQEILIPLRTSVFARWLQDDHKSAIAWFRSQEGQVISREEVMVYPDNDPFAAEEGRPPVKKLREVSLRFAVRHWVVNDQKGAYRWLEDHPEVVAELVMHDDDFDQVLTPAEYRKMLVKVLGPEERRRLLGKMLADKNLGMILSKVVPWPGQPVDEIWNFTRKEIAELEAANGMAKKLLESWQAQLKERF
jgi:hypothetical protein